MLVTYILQVTVCLAFFYALYHLALQKETWFTSNRIYLLSTLLASMVLPLIRIYVHNQHDTASVVTAPYIYVGAYLNTMNEIIITPDEQFIPWIRIIISFYAAGVFFMTYRIITSVNTILKMKRKGVVKEYFGQRCVLSTEVKSPFSFFNTVYLPFHHHFTDEEMSEIIAHEKTHVSGLHSMDVLFMEVVCIGLWPSPMVYLYRKKLRELHEFIADAEVLKNTSWENYASFLVAQKNEGLQHRLSNQLIYSQLKNRLIMMNKTPSIQSAKIKYFGLLPILILVLIIFSFRQRSSSSSSSVFNFPEYNSFNRYDEVMRVDTLPATYITAIKPDDPVIGEKGLKSFSDSDSTNREFPVFPGCDDVSENEKEKCSMTNLMSFIRKHLVYPDALKKSGKTGMVVIRFVVANDGYIKNTSVIKSLSPEADQAALDVFRIMNNEAGKWLPVRKEDKEVDTEMSLPISFTLGSGTESNQSHDVYRVVEEMPRFPGCEEWNGDKRNNCANEAMFRYIYDSIKYPEEDRSNGNEGMVVAQFIVEPDGSISHAEILRGVSPGIDAEILRVINGMNDLPEKWIPGRNGGNAVAVSYTLPFKFVLQKDPSRKNDEVPKQITTEEWNENPGKDQNETLREIPLLLFLSPNPVNDILKGEFFSWVKNVTIVNAAGQVIWSKKLSKNDHVFSIDVHDWISGKYVIQGVNEEQSRTASFIVQH